MRQLRTFAANKDDAEALLFKPEEIELLSRTTPDKANKTRVTFNWRSYVFVPGKKKFLQGHKCPKCGRHYWITSPECTTEIYTDRHRLLGKVVVDVYRAEHPDCADETIPKEKLEKFLTSVRLKRKAEISRKQEHDSGAPST